MKINFGSNLWYSSHVYNSNNVFGSVGIKSGKNIIFNTPYSQQEYEATVVNIIEHMRETGEWGQYFPTSMSHFAYNDTVAQEYFPMDQKEAESQGYRWTQDSEYTSQHSAYKPLDISQYQQYVVGTEIAQKHIDELLSATLVCAISGRPFKITKRELAFYIKNSLAIPELSHDERHRARMNIRNKRCLVQRECTNCQISLWSSYDLDAPQNTILCETCYKEAIYS